MTLRIVRRAAAACAAALLLCASAQAQLFRSYVASDGNDANPCTLAQPCRLLPAALAAVADGGEVWMLDSANYNTATVNVVKSVTIRAVPGAIGSVVATGSYAIFINTAGVKVTLHNLVVVPLTNPTYGIAFGQGAELRILDCEVAGFSNSAILATATGGFVYIRNTVVRNSAQGFAATTGVTASVDSSHFTGNGYGVTAGTGSQVTVTNSVISGNISAGVVAGALNGNKGKLVIEGSRITANGWGIQAYAGSPGGGEALEVTASRNVISDNAVGVYASQAASTTVTVVLDGNTISENAIGVTFVGTPTVYTRSNNTLTFNGSDLVGGSLTSLSAQ